MILSMRHIGIIDRLSLVREANMTVLGQFGELRGMTQ